MEGAWRGALLLGAWAMSAVCMAFAATGCGGSDSDASPSGIQAKDPGATFAPLVQLDPEDPWRPMSARWFIEHAVLWFAEDEGCPDRKIAVGRTLEDQQNEVHDWIYPIGLGKGPNYDRRPYGASCEFRGDASVYADQLTRPHDPGVRPPGLRTGEGYFLDLDDAGRPGPPAKDDVPVYVDRTDEGDSGVRLTYWMLYGMNDPAGPGAAVHEGDWERVDVLLRDEGDDRYKPQAIQLGGVHRDHPWSGLSRIDAHPAVVSARGSHALSPARTTSCVDCSRWRTWEALADAESQLWYGFGGAWGQLGATSAASGPLGPSNGYWPTPSEKLQELVEQQRSRH